MMWVVLGLGALAVVTAFSLTKVVLNSAINSGLLDIPNRRSAHAVPTPRGGGAAIVVTITLCVAILWMLGVSDGRLTAAVVFGGIAVSAIGFIDDKLGLSARIRLAVHFVCALTAVLALGGVPPIPVGRDFIELGLFGDFLGVLAIVWSINLFNFMDGIDGLAGAEGVFVCLAGALLSATFGTSQSVTAVAVVIGCSCAGFLAWNWPPARIFMGDVGSGYVGYVIAVTGMAATGENSAAIYAWLILGGVFFADASVTLLVRFKRGERVHEAHNLHAYQCLARRWGSHKRVTVLTIVLNVCWLLPLAWLALTQDQLGSWIAVIAIAPLCVLALGAGAGRGEPV